jgi:release factor glutamine methyltransferase
MLLAHALALSRLELYLQYDRPLVEEELVAVRDLLRRRHRQEPMAYLLGEESFRGLDFELPSGVLIPRPESELLVSLGLDHVRRLGRDLVKAADLGCGTGCLGIALAVEASQVHVQSVDISEIAVATTERNAERHGVANQVTATVGSWAWQLEGIGPFDLVVANPPYITSAEMSTIDVSVREYEPRQALDGGLDGLSCYRDLLRSLAQVVDSQTRVLLECDPRRVSGVSDLVLATWPEATLTIHRDLAARDRALEVLVP